MNTSSNLKRYASVGIPAAAVAAALYALWAISAYYLGTHLVRSVRSMAPAIIVTVGPIVALIAAIVLIKIATSGTGRHRDHMRRYERELEDWHHRVRYHQLNPKRYSEPGAAPIKPDADNRALRGVLVAVGVAGAIAAGIWFVQGVRWLNRLGFEQAEHYVEHVVEETGSHPAYETRLSVPQARLLFSQLNNVQGKITDVTYIGNQDTPEYCGTVVRGAGLNRAWTREIICVDPATGADRRASFEGNVGSTGGGWSSKLGDQVASVHRGLTFHDADIYGYITEDGEARLIVPVHRREGRLLEPYDVPAGVIEFTHTGERIWHEELTAGEIPGPVMPISIAEAVREGLNTRDGFLNYKKPVRNRNAVEATNASAGAGATDPNAENPSEFTLVRDGRLVYVTPLTPYGQSQTVIAYLEVYADEVTNGEMPVGAVYRLDEPQASLQLITQRVTSLYDADIDWMDTNDDTDASNRARIYELTPAQPGQVTLTIGTGTQALYRVYVDAELDGNNSFGEICIHRFRGDTQIRCDAADSEPTPVGALRGIADNNTSGSTSDDATNDSFDLTSVPTEDLVAELARRFPNG